MKKIKTLIAAAAVLGLGVTVSSISPAAVSMQTAATVKQGLVKVKNKYYYYNAKGKKVKNKWVTVKVKGKKQKYYFNKKGAALTGTAAVKNRLYGFDKKGRLNQNIRDLSCIPTKRTAKRSFRALNDPAEVENGIQFPCIFMYLFADCIFRTYDSSGDPCEKRHASAGKSGVLCIRGTGLCSADDRICTV